METIKNKLRDTKVQCSGATKEVKELFAKIGIQLPDSDFVYIDKDLNVEAVTPSIYKVLKCTEISPAWVKERIEAKEKESVVYEPGTFVVFTQPTLIAPYKFVAVVLEDKGKVISSLSIMGNTVCEDTATFSKSHLRKANAVEISQFTKALKEVGYQVHLIDGKLDLFYLRKYGQHYFTILFDKVNSSLVQQRWESHKRYDDLFYEYGNYFKSEEEAMAALKEMLGNK